jgi:glutaminyl-peptide cyclotransferase
MRRLLGIVLAGVMVLTPAVGLAQTTTPSPAPETTETPQQVEFLQTEVLNAYPHDSGSFTQGLVFHNGLLYESAGQYGDSDIRQVDIESSEIIQQTDVEAAFFAEGLALVDDRLIQITWKEQTAFIYDLETFEPLGTFDYTGEGWGLCYDGEVIWMSDGTDTLTARDPETFEVVREVQVTFEEYRLSQMVTEDGRALSEINELECVDGSVYANVWFTDYILEIDTETGAVTSIVGATELLTAEERASLPSGAVLNGIAYNTETETFLLTGKYWPKLFEVQFKPLEAGEG